MYIMKLSLLAVIVLALSAGAQDSKSVVAQTAAPVSSQILQFQSSFGIAFKGSVAEGIKCDARGNIYARLVSPSSSETYHGTGFLPVTRIKPDGTINGFFTVTADFPNFTVSDFFVMDDGTVFQAARSVSEGDNYVVSFSDRVPAGKAVRVNADPFVAHKIVVFKTGEFLLSGTRGDQNLTPYTAVFSPSGKLIKSIYEPEDEEAKQKAARLRTDVALDHPQHGNSFVIRGDAALGSDGNAYLLRAGDPASIYVISNKGQVLRKLTVPSPSPGLVARVLKASSDRLAVGFLKRGMTQGAIVITDYSGHLLTILEADDPRMLPGLMACYDGHEFRFVGFDGDNSPKINLAELK